MGYDNLYTLLHDFSNDIIIKEEVSLKNYCTFRVGGSSTVIEALNINALVGLINILNTNSIKYKVVGFGSNILFGDEGYSGVIITLRAINDITVKGSVLHCGAGASLPRISQLCAKNALSGAENFRMIPATVGGAIVNNAGVPSAEICDILQSVTYLKNGGIVTKDRANCCFSYRDSEFKGDDRIIVSATLQLQSGDAQKIMRDTQLNIAKRRLTQPINYYNAGSIFKRDGDIIPAKLIDECGLKGFRIGGAVVSQKHSGFIVNDGDAKSKDILQLIDYIKKKVQQKFNVLLQEELEYIGEKD